MRVRLHGPGGDFILVEGDNLLGRGRDCLLMVNDPRLSRHHARFVLHGAVVRVEDLGSRNGVLINGSRILAPTALTAGDIVVCGPCRFVCDCDPHLAPAPRSSSSDSHAHVSTDTEPMDPVLGHASGGRSRSRPIDLKIAAAVGSSHSGKSAAKPDIPSASIFNPDDAAEGGTSALADRPPSLTPTSHPPQHQTTGIVPHESSERQDGAQAPRQGGPPTPLRRLGAAALDGALIAGLLLLLLLPLCAIGYVVALHAANAAIVEGLPRLGGTHAGAPWGALVASLVEPGAFARAADLLAALQRGADRTPFLVLFATATAITLTTVLVLLFTTVAATVLQGGPLWHRRLGLEVVMVASGAYPSWLRSTWRWFLALWLWPLSPFAMVLGRRSPHDLLSGCEVRRRPH